MSIVGLKETPIIPLLSVANNDVCKWILWSLKKCDEKNIIGIQIKVPCNINGLHFNQIIIIIIKI